MTLAYPKGGVFWITGLSGSGKSTLASYVLSALRELGLPSVLLDGDELRELHQNLGGGYDRESRLKTAKFNASLCKLLSEQNIYVVCPTISLFHEVQNWNRENILRYVEIYIEARIEDLKKIDIKKIYRDYEDGIIKEVVGLDIEPEFPKNPELVIEYEQNLDLNIIGKKVVNLLIG